MQMLEGQKYISPQFPMPVDPTDQSSRVVSVSAETVQFVVASTNVNDVGSVAGTVVYARLVNGGVMDSTGAHIGDSADTSFVFGTGTILTTIRSMPIVGQFEDQTNSETSRATKLAALAANFTNGQYCIDHRMGMIYGKKATAGTADTGTYLVRSPLTTIVTGGGGSSTLTDDSAFTAGTSQVTPVGYFGNETGVDSVDEGDIGAARMSLRRAVKTDADTLAAGEDQTNNLIQVAEKPLAVSTYSPDIDVSTVAEASSITKASPGNLYGVTFSNGVAAIRFLQFFNSTTLPADTAVPVIVIQCPASTTVAASWPKGTFFSTGIVWCNSTTQNTKTIGAANSLARVEFK